MDVREIIQQYLQNCGYDGLYNSEGECACEIGDIAPCESLSLDCKAGYKRVDEAGVYDFVVSGIREADVKARQLDAIKELLYSRCLVSKTESDIIDIIKGGE